MNGESVDLHAKDPLYEDFLKRINDTLVSDHATELEEHHNAPPTLQIVGVPRTGTTLLNQLVAAHLDVAYIDHIVAAFYKAPLYGLRLSRKLLGTEHSITYNSHFGKTRHIHEPHEFGYFWKDLLGYHDMAAGQVTDDEINWNHVRRTLQSMTNDIGRPIVFKSFLLGLHMAAAQRAVPETCFVWVRRERVATAMSILRFREKVGGSRDGWVSLRPPNHEELGSFPPAEQVAAQVVGLEAWLQQQANVIDKAKLLILNYPEVCADPEGVLQSIAALLSRNGSKVSLTSNPPSSFVHAGIGDPNDPDLPAVRTALEAQTHV